MPEAKRSRSIMVVTVDDFPDIVILRQDQVSFLILVTESHNSAACKDDPAL